MDRNSRPLATYGTILSVQLDGCQMSPQEQEQEVEVEEEEVGLLKQAGLIRWLTFLLTTNWSQLEMDCFYFRSF